MKQPQPEKTNPKNLNQPAPAEQDPRIALFKEAVQEGRTQEVEALLAQGLPLNHDFGGGVTPLHMAIQEGQVDVVKSLLARGANPLTTTAAGWSAFHVVALNGNSEIAGQLLEKEQQVPKQVNVQGQTPMAIAKVHNHKEVLALFKKGSKKSWQFWK